MEALDSLAARIALTASREGEGREGLLARRYASALKAALLSKDTSYVSACLETAREVAGEMRYPSNRSRRSL